MTELEGPHLADPFELLEAHGISSSFSAPRHDCRCGASFVIDLSTDQPYAGSGDHIREALRAAAHAAAAFLAVAGNKAMTLPEEYRDMLAEIIAEDAGY